MRNSLTEFEIEDTILTLADIIRQKRELEDEVFELKARLKRQDQFLNESYQRTVNMTGAMLDAIANGCISPKEGVMCRKN